MIYSVKFRNFYSFKGETEIKFYKESNPKSEAYFSDKFGNYISKLTGVFGANASGKTNFIKVIPFLRWLMLDSFYSKEEEIAFKPFEFSEEKDEPSFFELVFSDNSNRIFKYEVELNKKMILSEKLFVKGDKNGERNKFRSLFERKSDSLDISPDLGAPKDFRVTKNVSVVSAGPKYNISLFLELKEYLDLVLNNDIRETGKFSKGEHEDIFEAAKFFFNNPKHREKMEKILGKFDLGMSGIDIKKSEINDPIKGIKGEQYSINGIHDFFGKKQSLPWGYESTGTKNLFVLMRYVLPALNSGRPLILDEMDSDLHPLIVPEILDLFISSETNPKNSQLIFSAHTAELFKKLDKEQIILIEKNKNGSSSAWYLDEIKGVESRDNYYAKYLAGAYGGIPEI